MYVCVCVYIYMNIGWPHFSGPPGALRRYTCIHTYINIYIYTCMVF